MANYKAAAQHGLPPDTPALLAEAVSTPQQTLTRTTIKALAEQLEGDISTSPALILYGPLAEGAERLMEKIELFLLGIGTGNLSMSRVRQNICCAQQIS